MAESNDHERTGWFDRLIAFGEKMLRGAPKGIKFNLAADAICTVIMLIAIAVVVPIVSRLTFKYSNELIFIAVVMALYNVPVRSTQRCFEYVYKIASVRRNKVAP